MEKSNHVKVSNIKDADIYIINACTAVGKEFEKNLKKIKEVGNKTIIYTGCVLEGEKEELKEVKDVKVLNSRNLSDWEKEAPFPVSSFGSNIDEKFQENKWKASIPIMDGCDQFCSYCAVPFARGREIYYPIKDIVNYAEKLINSGYKEISLTGSNILSYKPSFTQLVKRINDIDGDFWIKVNYFSLNKNISDDFLDSLASCDKFLPTMTIPLQSGSDRMLKLMNRNYTSDKFLEFIQKVKKKMPEAYIRTEVIVGFPGEENEDVKKTIRVLRKMSPDDIILYSFSSRPKTKAAKMDGEISKKEKIRRKKTIMNSLKETIMKNNKRLIGKKTDFIPYSNQSRKGGYVLGTIKEGIVAINKSNKIKPEKIKIKNVTSIENKDFNYSKKIFLVEGFSEN